MNQVQPLNNQDAASDNQAGSTNQSEKSTNPPLSHYSRVLNNNKRTNSRPGQRQKTKPAKETGQQESQTQARFDPEQTQAEANQENQYYTQSQLEESQIAPWMYKPLPEEDILTWTAPSRPFKKRSKKYFSTVATIGLLISLILGFAGQLAAIAVVVAVAFLAYILSVVPPQDINYKITTWGVRVENNLYYWEELGRFWFTDKYNEALLNIESARFPNRVTMLIGDQDPEVIKVILSEVLLNQKPEPTLYDKAASWLQEKIPLEIEE